MDLQLLIRFDGHLEAEVLFSDIDKGGFAVLADGCDSASHSLMRLWLKIIADGTVVCAVSDVC
jgi:hypothetical protein